MIPVSATADKFKEFAITRLRTANALKKEGVDTMLTEIPIGVLLVQEETQTKSEFSHKIYMLLLQLHLHKLTAPTARRKSRSMTRVHSSVNVHRYYCEERSKVLYDLTDMFLKFIQRASLSAVRDMTGIRRRLLQEGLELEHRWAQYRLFASKEQK